MSARHTTRLQIELSCNPVVGRVGNFVAALFGRDPKRQTHIALECLQSVIETRGGTTRRDRARLPRDVWLRRWKARLR